MMTIINSLPPLHGEGGRAKPGRVGKRIATPNLTGTALHFPTLTAEFILGRALRATRGRSVPPHEGDAGR